jgi:hypothetical protein
MFAAVAVKLTEVPAQIAPVGFGAIETVGVRIGLTTIVIVFDEAVVAEIHAPPVMLISHLTVLAFSNVLEVKIFEFVF